MSHRADTPLEVPATEVSHDFPDTNQEIWPDKIGAVDTGTWWGTDEQDEAEMADLRRRDHARQQLGGFGFTNNTQNPSR